MKPGFIYILTNKNHTTLYVGVSSDIVSRVAQHKAKVDKKSFPARYNLDKLVYYEAFQMIGDAIGREKQIKGGSRADKETLINSSNSEWLDLYEEVKNFYGHCEEKL
ncbi:MAG: GIY-YIG nuclease family protein [Aquaticitalea sp.]